jgi:hypothetical protein
MASPLLPELSLQKQELLRLLSHQPGFEVLVQLFDAACVTLNERLVKLNPEDRDYERKLRDHHLECRVINEFCSQVLKAIDYHSTAVSTRESEDRDVQEQLIERAAQLLRPGNPFGRNVIKSE